MAKAASSGFTLGPALLLIIVLTLDHNFLGCAALGQKEPAVFQVEGAKQVASLQPASQTGAHPPSRCDDLLASGKLHNDFPGIIAHATHSLNLEALEYILGISAPVSLEANALPVVNPDLTSDVPILGSPLRLSKNTTFNTFAMNQLDWVLMHMDDKHYDMGTYGTLERVMHQMHMIEVWNEAREAYKGLEASSPSDGFCACVTDVETNGVLKLLRFIALQIREPELMLGHHTSIRGRPIHWTGNIYRYAFFNQEATFGSMLDKGDVLPKLDSPQAWQSWKDLMAEMRGHGSLLVARYLHCAVYPTNGATLM